MERGDIPNTYKLLRTSVIDFYPILVGLFIHGLGHLIPGGLRFREWARG